MPCRLSQILSDLASMFAPLERCKLSCTCIWRSKSEKSKLIEPSASSPIHIAVAVMVTRREGTAAAVCNMTVGHSGGQTYELTSIQCRPADGQPIGLGPSAASVNPRPAQPGAASEGARRAASACLYIYIYIYIYIYYTYI